MPRRARDARPTSSSSSPGACSRGERWRRLPPPRTACGTPIVTAARRPPPRASRIRPHAPVSVADVPGIRRGTLPKFVPPQLATLVSQAPSGDAWIHEMKYDGYRILARLDHGRVSLMSRNARDWTEKFPTIAEAVGHLPAGRAMLDG